MKEIERKFLLHKLPKLPTLTSYSSTRFFLRSNPYEEERISEINGRYFHEKKIIISSTERMSTRREINVTEFKNLSSCSYSSITRNTLLVCKNPKITIHIYSGNLKDIKKVEVEFSSKQESRNFIPPEWMGKEITDTEIARDASLISLSPSKLQNILNDISKSS